MRLWRRRRRWSAYDVSRAEMIMRRWEEENPGQRAWFAHSPEEVVRMREQFIRAGCVVRVVPVYPPWDETS